MTAEISMPPKEVARPHEPPLRPVRVLIAEDHAVVREGIRMILTASDEFAVVGEAGDGETAVRLAQALRPDVVVMDIAMPRLNGVEATRQIKTLIPQTHVLILTMHEDESYIFTLLSLGASGYVFKRSAATELVEAVRAVARGEAFLFPAVARSLLRDYGGHDALTERERQVLVLIAEGLTSAAIAKTLLISVKTVQTHRTHIMEKLDLHDRSLLVRYAVRKGLIPA